MTLSQSSSESSLLLLAEMSHRVVNEYASAISSLSLAASKAEDSHAKASLRSAAVRLSDQAAAHRALQAPPAGTAIDLADYLESLCRALLQASLRDRGISLVLSTQGMVLEAGRCWRIGLIVAELITNARRHAFHGANGAITVNLVASHPHAIVSVSDTGQRSGEWRAGSGTRIVAALARETGGDVQWLRGPQGTTAMLSFWTGPLGDVACRSFVEGSSAAISPSGASLLPAHSEPSV